MRYEIVPSIIAKDQNEFNKIYNKIKIAKVIHLDIMDGDYVDNKSLWFTFKLPKHRYEAHLMTTRPEMFIGKHHDAIDTFIVHVKTTNDPDALIDFVHSMKKKIYFALHPKTPVSRIKKYLSKIDGVMVMTVMPGKYGAKFMPQMLNKIKQLRKLSKTMVIEADGGVNDETISMLVKAGANRFSVGSYIQKSKNAKQAMESLMSISIL